jgi:hypothetical protein
MSAVPDRATAAQTQGHPGAPVVDLIASYLHRVLPAGVKNL